MPDAVKYTTPAGAIVVVHPAPGWTAAQVMAKDVPPGSGNVEIINTADLPNDRIFRGAWVHKPKGVDVDMPKAREIVREKIRRARVAAFAESDADYIKADQNGDTARKNQAKARAQELRDAPASAAIDNANNPNALKNVRPAGLDWTRF